MGDVKMKLPPNMVRINGRWESNWKWYHRAIYRVSCWVQWILWKCRIFWHNSVADECTPDFSCCTKRHTGKTGFDALADLLEHERCKVTGSHEVGREPTT